MYYVPAQLNLWDSLRKAEWKASLNLEEQQ